MLLDGWVTLVVFFSPAIPAVLLCCFFYPKQSAIAALGITGVGLLGWTLLRNESAAMVKIA